jgi:hypothetical protein
MPQSALQPDGIVTAGATDSALSVGILNQRQFQRRRQAAQAFDETRCGMRSAVRCGAACTSALQAMHASWY